MERATTVERFITLLREAEETMLRETEDWRVVVRFRAVESV